MNFARDPRSVPVMLIRYMVAEGGRIGIDASAESLGVTVNAIHQGICRLRRDGFVITTLPSARAGPYRAHWYRLDDLSCGRRYLDALFGAGPRT